MLHSTSSLPPKKPPAGGRPPWATVALSTTYGVGVLMAAGEQMVPALLVLAGMLVLMVAWRRRIENPHVGKRADGRYSWVMATSFLWIILSGAVPAQWPWLGVLFGIAAATHLFLALHSGRFYLWAR